MSPGDSPLTVTLQPIGWGQSAYYPQPSGWQPSGWCTFHLLCSARSVARSDTPLGTGATGVHTTYNGLTILTPGSHNLNTPSFCHLSFKQLRHLYVFVLGICTGPPPCPIIDSLVPEGAHRGHTLSPAFESSDDASVRLSRVASVRPMQARTVTLAHEAEPCNI